MSGGESKIFARTVVAALLAVLVTGASVFLEAFDFSQAPRPPVTVP